MENNQQNNAAKTSMESDRANDGERKQSAGNVQAPENDSADVSPTTERHSESSLPGGTNETLGTP